MTTPTPRALLQWLSLAALVSRGWADSSNIPTYEAYDEPSFVYEGKMADEDDTARLSLGIYPGTKYCGVSNISDAEIPPEKYLAAEDACCKTHDECTHTIGPGKTDPISGLTSSCVFGQCRSCRNYCTDTSASPAWHWRPTALFLTSNTALKQVPPC